MKLITAALALLGAAVTEATTSSLRHHHKMMDLHKLNRKTLLRNAVPYHHGRRLDQEEEEQGYEISSQESIQFSDCVSLKVLSDEIMNNNDGDDGDGDGNEVNVYQYAYEGQVIAQQSYVIVDVCDSDDCGYKSDNNLFVVPLANYMQALAEYNKQKAERFCEACEETCWAEEEEAADEEEEGDEGGEEEDGGDERRKLANYVDCEECDEKAEMCAEQDEEGGNDDGDAPKDAFEWLEQMSECQETGSQWNGMDLFAGYICNSEGDGVEIAVFLDEECSLYTNQESFSNVMSNNDKQFLEDSEEMIYDAFKTAISCEDVEYDNGDGGNDNNGEDEVNEFCKKVMEEDALPLDNCGAYGDEAQDDNGDGNENAGNYDWYEYDLDEEAADNIYEVCVVIEGMQGEYSTVYDSSSGGSGNLYDFHKGEKSSGGGGKVFLILLLIAAVAGIAYYMLVLQKNKGQDSKKEPLTRKDGGAMA